MRSPGLTTKLLLLSLLLLPIHSRGEESESLPSKTVGCQTFLLRSGWNLVSITVMDVLDDWDDLFGSALDGGMSEEEADRIIGLDPISGEAVFAWMDLGDSWHGSLLQANPERTAAYWVQRRSEHGDSVLVVWTGDPIPSGQMERGVFQPGQHMIGTVYPDSVDLEQSGLAESGLTPSDGLLGIDPAAGFGAEALLDWDETQQRYRVAYWDGEQYRGEITHFVPGRGYLLAISHSLHWEGYGIPGDRVEATATSTLPGARRSNMQHQVHGEVAP